MKYSLLLALLAQFLFSSSSYAADDRPVVTPRTGAANYLIFYDRLRGFRTAETSAWGLKESAVYQTKFDEAVYQRAAKLFPRGAVTEEELREARMKREVSSMSIVRYDHEARAVAADVRIHEALLPYLRGEPMDLKKLYEMFKTSWDEQCLARSFRLKEAYAKKELADFNMKARDTLDRSKAISLEELQQAIATQEQSVSEVKTSQQLLDDCKRDEPDFSLIERIGLP